MVYNSANFWQDSGRVCGWVAKGEGKIKAEWKQWV